MAIDNKHILEVSELRSILDQGTDGAGATEMKVNQSAISQESAAVGTPYRWSFRDDKDGATGDYHECVNQDISAGVISEGHVGYYNDKGELSGDEGFVWDPDNTRVTLKEPTNDHELNINIDGSGNTVVYGPYDITIESWCAGDIYLKPASSSNQVIVSEGGVSLNYSEYTNQLSTVNPSSAQARLYWRNPDDRFKVRNSAGTVRDLAYTSDLSSFVDGSGSSNQVTFWSDSDTITSDAGFTFSGGRLSVSDISLTGLSSDTDNTVLILNSSNEVAHREIDSHVWGGSLVDGSGTANYLAMWSDSDTLTDSPLEYDSTSKSINFSVSNNDGSEYAIYAMWLDTTSPNNGDAIGELRYISDDSGGNQTTYARSLHSIGSATGGSEYGYVNHGVISYGSLKDILFLTGDGDGSSRAGVFVNDGAAFGIGTDNVDSSSTMEIYDGSYNLKLSNEGYTTIVTTCNTEVAYEITTPNGTVEFGALTSATPSSDLMVGLREGTSYVWSSGILYVQANGALDLSSISNDVTITPGSSSRGVIIDQGYFRHVSGSFGHVKTIEIELADDGSVSFESVFQDDLGWVFVVMVGDGSGQLSAACGGAQYFLQGSNNVVDLLSNNGGEFANTDSDGFFCIFSDGDGTYTIRNRMGATRHSIISYMGTR